MPCECRQIDARNWENGSDFDWGSAYFFRVFTPLFFHIPYRVDRDIEMARFEITALGYKTKHPLKIVYRGRMVPRSRAHRDRKT